MSENKKALSLDDLENVAGGVIYYQESPTGCALCNAEGQILATVDSLETANSLATQYGCTVAAAETASKNALAAKKALATKSPM